MKRRSHELIALPVLVLALSAGACSDPVDPDQPCRSDSRTQAGNLEEAAEHYQQVLEIRPDDAYANYNLGVIEQGDGRTALAEGYYRAALDADPNFVAALFNLAILRTQVNAIQEAIDLYERVLALQPDYAAAHLNLGLLLQASEQAKEGTEHLNQAIELDPTLADRLDSEPIPPSGGSAPGGSAGSGVTLRLPRSVSLSRRRQQGHVRIIPFAGTCRG